MNLNIGDIVNFWEIEDKYFNKTKYVIDCIIGDEIYVHELNTGNKNLFTDNTPYKILGNINSF